jgi:hypothetical protein
MKHTTRIVLLGLLAVIILLIVVLPRLGILSPGDDQFAVTANPAVDLQAAKDAGQPVFLEFYGKG